MCFERIIKAITMGQYNKTPKVHVVRKREVKRRRFYERLTTDEEIYEDSQSVAADVYNRQDFTKAIKEGLPKLIENEPESQSWLEGTERVVVARESNQREHSSAPNNRETTKIQNRGSNPLGFLSTSMSPSRATLDQKHGPSCLPHAFCFFLLLFCILSLYYERKTG